MLQNSGPRNAGPTRARRKAGAARIPANKLGIALFPPVTLEFNKHVRMVFAGGEAWRRETCRKTVP